VGRIHGVAVTARRGALEEPVPGASPQLNEDEQLELIRWPLSGGDRGAPPYSIVWHPAAAVSVLPSDLDTAFDRGLHRLSGVQRGYVPARPVLLVAGDQAADFALAYAWERLYGRSVWLPSEWWPDPDATTRVTTTIRLLLDDLGFDANTPDRRLQLTTTSAAPEALATLAGVLRKPLIHLVTLAGQASRAVAVEDAVFDRSGIPGLVGCLCVARGRPSRPSRRRPPPDRPPGSELEDELPRLPIGQSAIRLLLAPFQE
jgi:hypothetical protein